MHHYVESERGCGREEVFDRNAAKVCKAYQIADRALIYSVQPKLRNESHMNNTL